MKIDTRAWVKKAEDDFQVAHLLYQRQHTYHDQLAFHCQQSTEKYLKALLEEAGVLIPKTHNLAALAVLVAPHFPGVKKHQRGMIFLTRFAVSSRYPGEDVTKRQATASLRWATLAPLGH